MDPTASQAEDSPSMVGTFPVIREDIVSTPDTCGDKPRIAGSRIRVKDVVVWYHRQGMTPAEIISKWPHLALSDIHAALAYSHDHREEINAPSWQPTKLGMRSRRLRALPCFRRCSRHGRPMPQTIRFHPARPALVRPRIDRYRLVNRRPGRDVAALPSLPRVIVERR
jgi:uncharacterized protein (DUF433 family)